MLNDVTEDNRSQGDGGDGVQEHGGGLYHAADGAGLIHQILDLCVGRTIHRSTRGKLASSLLRPVLLTSVVSVAERPFTAKTHVYISTFLHVYIAMVSAANQSQYILRSCGHLCKAK